MKRFVGILIAILSLCLVFSVSAQAKDPEVKFNSTITFSKSEQLSHTNDGSYPVYTSIYRYKVVESVVPKNGSCKVEETSSGFVVTFNRAGTASFQVTSHTRETYSKYNTETQQVLDFYDKNSASATETRSYTVRGLAEEYKVPDGYVGVYKDGYEYIDFASPEVVAAKFGYGSLVRSATLQNFYGFSYKFENNTFYVELDNFTGNGIYFRCPKKDTSVFISLKGTNNLTGVMMAYEKNMDFTALAASGSKSGLLIYAAEDGAELNINMRVLPGRNDGSSVKRFAPFCFSGGTQLQQLIAGTRGTVNVTLQTDAAAIGKRSVSLSAADLLVKDTEVNYTYQTTGCLDGYTGVNGRLTLDGDAVFSGTLQNDRTVNTKDEYLFPKITYKSGFTGGAYFDCAGGYFMNPSKTVSNEVFIPNDLHQYKEAVNGKNCRAVVKGGSSRYAGIKAVELDAIRNAFPDIRINQALPVSMQGTGFAASLTWTDENGQSAAYAETGKTYTTRAVFVPTKGYYTYLRNLDPAYKNQLRSPIVQSVSNVIQKNTSTTRYDALDFTLFRLQTGSPTFTKQPVSVYANPGETVQFYAPFTNVTYDPAAKAYLAEWHIVTKIKIFGVTVPLDRVLSDSATYSGSHTSTLTVKTNEAVFGAVYYCRIYGAGYAPAESDRVRVMKYNTVSALSMAVSLGSGMQPNVGSSPDTASPYAFDEAGQNLYFSDAVSLDKAKSFWYEGAAVKNPTPMSASKTFEKGKTYTYRFVFNAKTGYQFDKNIACTFYNNEKTEPAQVFFNDNNNRTVCTVDFTFGPIREVIGVSSYDLHFNAFPVPYEGADFSPTAVERNYANYSILTQSGWYADAACTKEAAAQVGGICYVKLTLKAHDSCMFNPNADKSNTVITLYGVDGSGLHEDFFDVIPYGENYEYMDITIGLNCTEKRVKTLSLIGLDAPSEGDKMDYTAAVEPAGFSVISVSYTDDMEDLLPVGYLPKAGETLNVDLVIAAGENVGFASDVELEWNAAGAPMKTAPSTDSSLKANERRFMFTLPVHTHEWVNAENAVYLKKTASCVAGTTYYKSCLYCGRQGTATFSLNDKTAHTLTKTAAKAATCTANGNKAYYTCSVCGKYFSDAAGKKEITKASTVIKAAHKIKAVAAKAATCTANGNKAYYTCSVCGKCFSDAAGTKEIAKTAVVTKAAHTTKKVAAKAATCTANGNKAYYTCTKCGKYFSDAAGTKEITKASAVIKAGHAIKAVAAKAATCTAKGNKAYYACSVCGKCFSDAAGTKEITKTSTVLKALGHKYGAWTKLNDTQHQRVCANNKSHVEKADHTWDGGVVTKAPTAAAEGEKTFTCTVCGATKQQSVPKTGFLPGDVNLDGSVTAADARLALRAAVGLESYAIGSAPFLAADVDHSGTITAADARLILRAAVGLETLK